MLDRAALRHQLPVFSHEILLGSTLHMEAAVLLELPGPGTPDDAQLGAVQTTSCSAYLLCHYALHGHRDELEIALCLLMQASSAALTMHDAAMTTHHTTLCTQG